MPDSLARETSPLAASNLTLPEVFALVNGDLQEVERRLATVERPDVPMTAEIMDHVLAMQGKRVRPLLLLLVARLGKPSAEDVLWASTVIELVHTLRDHDVPVIIISHNLQDVFAAADRVVIMRRGRKVGERMIADTSMDELVSLMVGGEVVQPA